MSRGLRSLLLVLVVSIVGAVPSTIADAGAVEPGGIDLIVDHGSSGIASGSDLATSGAAVRAADVAAIDAGTARADRLDHRFGCLVATPPAGVPGAVARDVRQRVEPVTNSGSGGPGHDAASRAPPVDPS